VENSVGNDLIGVSQEERDSTCDDWAAAAAAGHLLQQGSTDTNINNLAFTFEPKVRKKIPV
jgi:hypothetical protein